METLRRRFRVLGRTGSASVEMALIVPLLVYMMMGIVEMGVMVNAYMQVRTVAREGARVAAVGRIPADVDARATAVAAALNRTHMTVTKQYRTYLGSGSWGEWKELVPDGAGSNTAPAGSHIRVTVTYVHRLLMPGMFRVLADGHTGVNKTITSRVVMRRE